jgi:lipid-A-disaccharide synthase
MSQQIYKFFIIAGEASGDLLGSRLISEIKNYLAKYSQNNNYKLEFYGVGGRLMQDQGLRTIFPIEELSVMGIFEILPHLPKLINLINLTAKEINEYNPDYLITIDSPDFSFRVVKKAIKIFNISNKLLPNNSKTFFKKIHLIAPSVWAYREGRAKKIAKIYDLLLAILPFEPPYFEKYNLKTIFIGHPLMDNPPDIDSKAKIKKDFFKKYQIDEKCKLITTTPGSRISEVKKIFPQFIASLNLLKQNNYNIVVAIPTLPKTASLIKKMAQKLEMPYFLIDNQANQNSEMFFASDFALAKSGTNSLEFALYQVPMLVAYKVNILTFWLVKRLIKVKFANIINIIANRQIIPEAIQNDCNPQFIATNIANLLNNKGVVIQQISQSQEIMKMLGLNYIKDQEKQRESLLSKAIFELMKR